MSEQTNTQSTDDDEISRDIARNYRNAVMSLRHQVEFDDVPWKDALESVLDDFTLGLAQIADISTKAEKRYGQTKLADQIDALGSKLLGES